MWSVCRQQVERHELDMHGATSARASVRRHVGQLQNILRRCPPKTGALLELHRNADRTLWAPGAGGSINLKPNDEVDQALPEGFYVYEPEISPQSQPVEGKSASDLTEERLLRIRKREADHSACTSTPNGKRYRLTSTGPADRGSRQLEGSQASS